MGIDVKFINLGGGDEQPPKELILGVKFTMHMVELAKLVIDDGKAESVPMVLAKFKKEVLRGEAIKGGIPEAEVDEFLNACEDKCKHLLLQMAAEHVCKKLSPKEKLEHIKEIISKLEEGIDEEEKKFQQEKQSVSQQKSGNNRIQAHLN